MSAQFATLFAACILGAAHAHGLYEVPDACKNSSSNATAQRHSAVKEGKLAAIISTTPEVLSQQSPPSTGCECTSQGDGDDMMLGATWTLSTGGEKFGWCKYAPKASVNCPHCCAIGKVLPPASASRAVAELQKAVEAQLRLLKVRSDSQPSARCAKRRPDLRSPPQVAPEPQPIPEEAEATEAQVASTRVDVEVAEELGEVSGEIAASPSEMLSDSGSRIFIGSADDGGFDAEVAFKNAWAERRAEDAKRGIGKASESVGLTSHEQVMISSMGKLLPAARRVLGLMGYIRS